MNRVVDLPVKAWANWPYKNTTFLIISLLAFFWLLEYPFVQNTLTYAGSLGYLGSFISGIFFVSLFTVAPAAVIIFDVANTLNPIWVAVTAGVGAVIGDYLIFLFLKDRVFEELAPLLAWSKGTFVGRLFASPFFVWLLPISGAFFIASPLPDEVGLSLLGLSEIKTWQFLVVTFLLNAVGIFLIIILAGSK